MCKHGFYLIVLMIACFLIGKSRFNKPKFLRIAGTVKRRRGFVKASVYLALNWKFKEGTRSSGILKVYHTINPATAVECRYG